MPASLIACTNATGYCFTWISISLRQSGIRLAWPLTCNLWLWADHRIDVRNLIAMSNSIKLVLTFWRTHVTCCYDCKILQKYLIQLKSVCPYGKSQNTISLCEDWNQFSIISVWFAMLRSHTAPYCDYLWFTYIFAAFGFSTPSSGSALIILNLRPCNCFPMRYDVSKMAAQTDVLCVH